MACSRNEAQTFWSAGASEARPRFGWRWERGIAYPKRRRRFALPAHSIGNVYSPNGFLCNEDREKKSSLRKRPPLAKVPPSRSNDGRAE